MNKAKPPPPETPALPPWPPWHIRQRSLGPADFDAMYVAVNARLDVIDDVFEMQQLEWEEKQDYRGPPPPTPDELHQQRWEFELGRAKSAARAGNYDRLRRMIPELAAFFNPPPRRQPRRVDYSLRDWRLRRAIDDVYRIRQLWQRHYGRWKRPESDDVQAEAIAATRHGLNEADLREAMKRGTRGLYGSRYKLPTNLPI